MDTEGSEARPTGPFPPYPLAGVARRLASLVYEILLAFVIAFVAGILFYGAASGRLTGLTRHVFQAYIVVVLGIYFVWCWHRGGQTLPMKTWKLRLVRVDGSPLSMKVALLRYVLAWVSALCAGAGFVWAFIDRDRQFMHDRIAGTCIIRVQP